MLSDAFHVIEELSLFSHDFSISMDFYKNGCLKGKLRPFNVAPQIEKEFHGFFTIVDQQVKICFIIDWGDPNVQHEVLTAYSGVLSEKTNGELFLVLRWLTITECGGQECTTEDIALLSIDHELILK